MTDAEWRIWYLVRRRGLLGHKFKRQVPIGPYIADFVCLEEKLIIEADGHQHTSQQSYDEIRDAYLRKRGYRVLRFWNNEVLRNQDGVLAVIVEALQDPSP